MEEAEKRTTTKMAADGKSEVTAVDNFCRFCAKCLRINGVISNSILIFAPDRPGRPIIQRMADLGLKVGDVRERSRRMCKCCLNAMKRLERDLKLFQIWQQEEEKFTEAAAACVEEKKEEQSARSHSPRPGRTRAFRPKPVQVSTEAEAKIIHHLSTRNWRTAANLISVHKDLMKELNLKMMNPRNSTEPLRAAATSQGPTNTILLYSDVPVLVKQTEVVPVQQAPCVLRLLPQQHDSAQQQQQGVQIDAVKQEDTVFSVKTESTDEEQLCTKSEEESGVPEFIYDPDQDLDETESNISVDPHLDLDSETEEQADDSSNTDGSFRPMEADKEDNNKAYTSDADSTLTKSKRPKYENAKQCSFCEKAFKRNWNLKTHILIHTGKRPFVCSVCNKTFTQKQHLTSHMVKHTGERPFSCSVCQKTFGLKTSFKVHMMKHMITSSQKELVDKNTEMTCSSWT